MAIDADHAKRFASRLHDRNLLEDGKNIAASLGLELETLLHDLKGGRVADANLREAKSAGCGLIVIDTHGRRGF